MRVSSRTLKVLASLSFALQLGGCAGAGHRPKLSSDTPARFEHTDCWFESLSGGARVECGYLVVPENRDRKTSPEIRIAVAILRRDATASDDAAAVFLPGGPGDAGLDGISGLAQATGSIRAQRDFVVLDYRGVGRSTPSLSCAREDVSGDDERAMISACRDALEEDDIDLSAYTSAHIARDVADLRHALGYDGVHLVGNSYGTRAALTILRDWAPMVRTAVLDAAVPPEIGVYEEAPAAAARALDRVFSACTSSTDCAARFADPAADFSAALAAIDRHPLDVDVEHGGQITHVAVDRKLFVSLLVQCLTRDVLAVAVPALVHGAIAGDVSGLRELLRPVPAGRQSNALLSSLGMHLSVQCNEEFPFNSEVRAKAVEAENPLTAVLSTYAVQKARCSAWTLPTIDSRDTERVSSDKPVLFLSGEFDPLTSPEWVEGARHNLPTSAHLIRAGGGHGTLHDVCGFDLVAAYESDPSHAPELECDTNHPRLPFAADAAKSIRAAGL